MIRTRVKLTFSNSRASENFTLNFHFHLCQLRSKTVFLSHLFILFLEKCCLGEKVWPKTSVWLLYLFFIWDDSDIEEIFWIHLLYTPMKCRFITLKMKIWILKIKISRISTFDLVIWKNLINVKRKKIDSPVLKHFLSLGSLELHYFKLLFCDTIIENIHQC